MRVYYKLNKKKLVSRLQKARLKKAWTYAQVTRALSPYINKTLTKQAIMAYEKGLNTPSHETIPYLLAVLDIPSRAVYEKIKINL